MLKRCYKAYFRERFLLKNLEGIGKVSNFALAFGNGGSAGAAAATAAVGQPGEAERFSKKVAKNFGNSKLSCNFATFFAPPEKGGPEIEH